jgi:hypothetical protein
VSATAPGRSCPLRYRYGARAIAQAAEKEAQTLYVIGGLYGNVPALDAAEAMARAEAGPVTLCFNGDFNWFDVDDRPFAEINRRVLSHDAIVGNVEAEFDSPDDAAGCGCAYPAHVDAGIVERSNAIHRELTRTARRHPDILQRIAALPMLARYRVAGCRVGVVHGDADSLAGWNFDVEALDDPASQPALLTAFEAAAVDLFACTHTCLPALRQLGIGPERQGVVANNGAAGMPNFAGELHGLLTRVGRSPSPHPALHEIRVAGAHVALLPIRYDAARWEAEFVAQWPPGSPAWLSYHARITRGPAYRPERAVTTPLHLLPRRGGRPRRS